MLGSSPATTDALHLGVRNILARLFLPSWRFFDDALTWVVLEVRVTPRATESNDTPGPEVLAAGPWMEVLRPPKRRLHHLLWNPEGNATLAGYSLLERLLMDADADPADFAVTTRMVEALARRELAALGVAPQGSTFEYRVRDRRPGGDEELAVSQPIAC